MNAAHIQNDAETRHHNNRPEYCGLVINLTKPPRELRDALTPLDAHLIHMVLGVSGEAGELLDAIKKSTVYRKPIDRENVIEELGDLEFYMEGLRSALGITRVETLEHNERKLQRRYGERYSDNSAQRRADKTTS